MLPVPSDHRVEVRAEGRVGVVVAKPSHRHAFGPLDGVLHLVGHLQPCHGLHLRKHQQRERQRTRSRLYPWLIVHREPAGPHMNEARILLVNFHQLLICFVLHGRLGVRSHGNQVGHTLKQTSFISGDFISKLIYFPQYWQQKSSCLCFNEMAPQQERGNTCTGWMRPWLRVSVMTLRAKWRTVD